MGEKSPPQSALSDDERAWLVAVESADSLAELANIVGTVSQHQAYIAAKQRWQTLRERTEVAETEAELPGTRVDLGGRTVVVHGVTHADTTAEQRLLRDHVQAFLDAGEAVYCEQGIRPMYFTDMEAVCEIDDYRWAMYHCTERDIDSHVPGAIERSFLEDERLGADIRAVASTFRERAFTLIDAGKHMYGDAFTAAIGDLASAFLTSHEELATGEDFTSFQLSKQAARNPAMLADLQRYYRTVFLPQPLEREWLRRHDPELELFTHARNERIAAYILSNGPDTDLIHVITGAAHQPGVAYYLRAYRENEWSYEPFEIVP
ncbi:hypothetical protein SAMN05216226_10229 [Halovenus aranensis]|uniref:Uncharacterized protein n=1 Tax=Halovenus aranensis TaxID=890420 RepID=A0A1G8SLC0_9EURY|nr:hypothetical protein [Halovenus aranensis]SDJ30007.1 hypothetical protein SAMN05216226_10229 [Halovenus aranensis]